jgi:hypothetical protein
MHCSHLHNFLLASILRPGRTGLRKVRFAYYTVYDYTIGHNGYEVITSTLDDDSNEVRHAHVQRLRTAIWSNHEM